MIGRSCAVVHLLCYCATQFLAQARLSPLYPLAHLSLARAALTGETARSRKAYEDFLALWKEADADLPILRAAKHVVANLLALTW